MMALTVEVTEQGVLQVKSPAFKPGDEVVLETCEGGVRNADKGQWSEIKKVLERIDRLDFPRRTHEEILRDLHELRG